MKRAMLNPQQTIDFGGHGPPDRLVLGDNLAVLASIPGALLDLVYLDPPFGTGQARTARGGSYGDDLRDPARLAAWLEPRLAECRRVLCASGSLFVHLDYRTVHHVKVALDRVFGHRRFINEIVWCYSVGGKSQRSFGRKHDTILWYGRSGDYAFFPAAVRIPRKPGSHMRVKLDAHGQAVQEKTDRKTGKVYRYPVARGKLPEDWWTDIETLNRSDRERVGWPTQKPERLLERLVRAACPERGRVADFFAGSGTTAVVAQRLGRSFIAVDREAAAVSLAAERLVRAGRALARTGAPPPALAIESESFPATERLLVSLKG